MSRSMTKTLLVSFSAAALLALAPPARAAMAVDTGTPSGNAIGALAFDAFDWVAGRVDFAHAAQIDAIQGHILGGTAGETFDVSLFAADGGAGLGTLLYSATATYGADGWNGVSGLQGWDVAAGSYWIEFEIQGADTLGSSSVTGALLDTGAPHPLATTAFTSDAGFSHAGSPLSFGLRVSTVPWPSPASLMLAGLALLSTLRLARRR
jgi:hypothetical protein